MAEELREESSRVGRSEGASRHRVDSDARLGGTISENEGSGRESKTLSLSLYPYIYLSIYLSISLSPNCCRPFIRFRGSRLRVSSLRLLTRQRSLLKRATSCALPRVPSKDDRLERILTTAFSQSSERNARS